MNNVRQADIYQWSQNTFGETAALPDERALRFIEEALELAQACGLNHKEVMKVAARVYSRERGNKFREFGQAGLTLEALAECHRVDLNDAANHEFKRILKIPQEEFAQRHAAKVADGIAN